MLASRVLTSSTCGRHDTELLADHLITLVTAAAITASSTAVINGFVEEDARKRGFSHFSSFLLPASEATYVVEIITERKRDGNGILLAETCNRH